MFVFWASIILGFVLTIWFAYNLGFDKGVWLTIYNPGSKRVKSVLNKDESFWSHY